ncbi:MAG: type III-B CRISPR module-associated Cmr3 family protein [Burkholderiaceae bacterium]
MNPDPSFCFLEPLDVLFLRGNQAFGEPGSYGESFVPPWPSVAAGAIRSRILADDQTDPEAFARGAAHPSLGTPDYPGRFRLTHFQLARRTGPEDALELLYPVPADLSVMADMSTGGTLRCRSVRSLRPVSHHHALASSWPLALLPVLSQNSREKPGSGWWLRQQGWQRYLGNQEISTDDLIHSSQLWRFDERVGIGLDRGKRSAADGKLFTVRAIAFHENTGFLAGVHGARMPHKGLLRFGGDGRAVRVQAATPRIPMPDFSRIVHARRCRIVLTSPGIFREGWQLPGSNTAHQITLPGFKARIVCAAMTPTETVSGWDLARQRPKPAQKAVGSGSVYWLDELETTPEALGKLATHGLWQEPCEDPHRQAEGFNRFIFAVF